MTDSTENTKQALEVGDTVYVQPYQTQAMNGVWSDGYLSGSTGVLTRLRKDSDWRSAPNLATVRVLRDNSTEAWEGTRPIEALTLVTKGPGRFELGVTHPFSEEELRLQRWNAHVLRCNEHDLTHQGFSNPATFLADLYLSQDQRFIAELPSLWRKDGSVNPDKVRKLFEQHGHVIDSWAYECPVEAPAEFANHSNPIRNKLRVDWDEVADGFSRKNMHESMPDHVVRAAA